MNCNDHEISRLGARPGITFHEKVYEKLKPESCDVVL